MVWNSYLVRTPVPASGISCASTRASAPPTLAASGQLLIQFLVSLSREVDPVPRRQQKVRCSIAFITHLHYLSLAPSQLSADLNSFSKFDVVDEHQFLTRVCEFTWAEVSQRLHDQLGWESYLDPYSLCHFQDCVRPQGLCRKLIFPFSSHNTLSPMSRSLP